MLFKKKIKNCILLSCSIFSENKSQTLLDLLDAINESNIDCDVYVGINYSSIPNVENILEEYKSLNIYYERLQDPNLYSQSDASAYQVCLKMLNESKKQYELCWFIHTKGAVNDYSNYLRMWYMKYFIKRHNFIKDMIDTYSLGSYALLATPQLDRHYSEKDSVVYLFSDENVSPFDKYRVRYFYLHSFYVIKFDIVRMFLDFVNKTEWYNVKLDRYYFEGIFPNIVSKSGNIQYVENYCTNNKLNISELLYQWKVKNNLDINLDIPHKYYNFDQLKPGEM